MRSLTMVILLPLLVLFCLGGGAFFIWWSIAAMPTLGPIALVLGLPSAAVVGCVASYAAWTWLFYMGLRD